ncbi:hypothetical protein DS742_14295 [Lacrimispora amygdalina]|uniref:Uncharacterized protein n=1 Tax=Lacrimispora amygdalina TaxID=253257 RepID=A0A3E2NBM2_9FIRM|nr:hypothetical protein [Clostridium indicum]RFZ78280.1 hypothetical protein DS742_14295 [Clostridium indicum]
MNEDFIVVSKEEAIKKIMEAPGDTVIIGRISITSPAMHYSHDKPVRGKKKDGKLLIIAANEIEYQDNNCFGTLSLHGIRKEKEDESIIHSILFPQKE